MLGIPLKEMPKYKRTQFDEDDISSNGGAPTSTTPHGIAFYTPTSIWTKCSLVEKILGALLLLFVIIIIILGSMLQVSVHKHEPEKPDYCVTPACVTVASAILNAMDTSEDPCKNFYLYACGGWIKSNPIPEGKSIWGTFGLLWQENQLVMKHVLEQPLNESLNESEKKAKIYFLSCMDENKTIEKLDAKPMIEIMVELGGWNISGDFNFTKWSMQSKLQMLHGRYAFGSFFNVWVAEDDRNSSRNILQVDQGGFVLPTRDFYINKTDDDEILSVYLQYMTSVGVLLGAEYNSTYEQMRQILQLERRIAEITIPADQRRDEEELYHKMQISDLQSLAPFIDWVEYFNFQFSHISKEIKSTEEIVVLAPEFLKNLTTVILDYQNSIDGQIILHNYMMWFAVKSMVPYLSKPFRDAIKPLTEVLQGSSGGEVAWRSCVSETDGVIGFALGAMFVRSVFQGSSKEKHAHAEQMIEQIRTAFKKNLPELTWMDEETRKAAREKADAITDMIGFPDYILNSHELDKRYEELHFNIDEYFMNNIRELQYTLRRNLKKLDVPVNKTAWGMTPPTVNAYYSPTRNEIVFPAGILQSPFYDKNYPKSLNFGGMGVVMGHELTHGFDDQGREYDKFGNMRPWWNNQSIARFKERAQCIIDQYSNYTVNGENINGRQTLGENIADNGGLKSAFRAYEDWAKTYGEERPLPGLNLTHRQLFFLGFAQVWCSASTVAAEHLQLLNDPHSPAQFRVIGSLSNSEEFSRLYNCPVGSYMNPSNKCEVW